MQISSYEPSRPEIEDFLKSPVWNFLAGTLKQRIRALDSSWRDVDDLTKLKILQAQVGEDEWLLRLVEVMLHDAYDREEEQLNA